jgi:hypothetical protein
VVGRQGDLALLDQMQAEHAQIDPLLAAVDDALAGNGGSPARPVRDLSAALAQHLTHEQQAALPLILSARRPRTGVPSPARCVAARASKAQPSTCQ